MARKIEAAMRKLLTLALVCLLGKSAQAANWNDWQLLARLQAGDLVRLSLKTGRVDGVFQSWTPEQVTVGTITAKREDVRKIERYRPGAWSRGKTAAVGALAGFGSGFVIGAALGPSARGCTGWSLFCMDRGTSSVLIGGTFAIIGAGVGALLPSHTRELIYSAR